MPSDYTDYNLLLLLCAHSSTVTVPHLQGTSTDWTHDTASQPMTSSFKTQDIISQSEKVLPFPYLRPASTASHHLSFQYTLFFHTHVVKWSGRIQWSIHFLYACREAAEVKYGAESLRCKRMTPIRKGTKQDQHSAYPQNFLLFKLWNFHPLMRFSVSDSASYYTEKIESIMKKFFLNLNLLCVLSWPPGLPSQPLTSLSLQFRLDHIPFPFLRILKQPSLFSILYAHSLPFNKLLFLYF